MKILKNAGNFEVLSKSENVISLIATAARTCYQSHDKSSDESDKRLVQNLMNRGHFAMFEMANMTVRFSNVSRGFTHEIVRHRLCSFAQESTRYVDESDFHVIAPPHHEEDDPGESIYSLSDIFQKCEKYYRSLRSMGWKVEDARQVLPIAIKSQIVVNANLREWRHIFTMRCDKFAHWEIRGMMCKLLSWCQNNIPIVFDDFHFFESNNIEYARPVQSVSNIIDILNHAEKVYGTQLTEKLNEKYCNISKQVEK